MDNKPKVPKWLKHLKGDLLAIISLRKYETFKQDFNKSIKFCGDLEKVKKQFLIYILNKTLTIFDYNKFSSIKSAIDQCIQYHETVFGNEEDSNVAMSIAKIYALNALDARITDDAADAARHAMSATSLSCPRFRDWDDNNWACSAAKVAIWSTTSSIYVPKCVSESVSWASSDNLDYKIAEYEKYADKLIQLIKECNSVKICTIEDFKIGMKVKHERHGKGKVIKVNVDCISVLFKNSVDVWCFYENKVHPKGKVSALTIINKVKRQKITMQNIKDVIKSPENKEHFDMIIRSRLV